MSRFISAVISLAFAITTMASDSIPFGFSRPLQWRIGAELTPAWVPGTNNFLKGNNRANKRINTALATNIRTDFSFNQSTRPGLLYKGLCQGLGIESTSFFANSLLGNPVSVYVYQGAPFLYFSDRLSLGYEWQFGAAFGWEHFNKETAYNNEAVSTSVTAHMGLGLKLLYSLSDRWQMSVGLSAKHFSNGNTSLPNSGVNYIGASIGIAYTINPQKEIRTNHNKNAIIEEADKGHWLYDITAYGAWRKRVATIGNPPESQLCPGKFGVLGLQFSPLRSLNRWVAVGPSLDMQWDESGGLISHWIEGTYGEMIKFNRPSFIKQINLGLSAHAELTMPIFSVNVGLGYDFVNPKGDKAFYQSLTLKTFVTKKLYLNTGYRLASFKYPQNLMLGIGLRL